MIKRIFSIIYKLLSIIFFILVFASVLSIVLVFLNGRQKEYEKSITLDSSITSINVDEYMPFNNDSKIVILEEESNLRLREKFPIVDGAAALFPVYSAFVNAIYDEETFTELERLQDEVEYNYLGLHSGFFQYNNTVEGYKKLAEKQIDIFFRRISF